MEDSLRTRKELIQITCGNSLASQPETREPTKQLGEELLNRFKKKVLKRRALRDDSNLEGLGERY
jgi:hypothetical protein